jgi:hypothetical protein
VILANSHGCHIPKLTTNDAAATKTIKRPINRMVPFPPLGSASTLMLDLDLSFFGNGFTKRVMEKNGFLMAQPKKKVYTCLSSGYCV